MNAGDAAALIMTVHKKLQLRTALIKPCLKLCRLVWHEQIGFSLACMSPPEEHFNVCAPAAYTMLNVDSLTPPLLPPPPRLLD